MTRFSQAFTDWTRPRAAPLKGATGIGCTPEASTSQGTSTTSVSRSVGIEENPPSPFPTLRIMRAGVFVASAFMRSRATFW